jgi:hypothetical protein
MNLMMLGRFVALLVLALQLQPAVLPALCDGTSAAQATDCDKPMPPAHDGLAVTGQQGHGPCLNPAFCGIAPTATPSSALSIVSVIESREVRHFLRPGVHAIEALAPLPPPPEA